MSNEKLKEALEEIKPILDKHNVAAVVVLCRPDEMEYYVHMTPSWSCAKYDGEKVHFHAPREDFESDTARHECVTQTTGMIVGFKDGCQHIADEMTNIAEHLSKFFEIKHRSKRF